MIIAVSRIGLVWDRALAAEREAQALQADVASLAGAALITVIGR